MVVIVKGLKLNHLERPKVHVHQIEMLPEFLGGKKIIGKFREIENRQFKKFRIF